MITTPIHDPELAALAAELQRDTPGLERLPALRRAAELLDELESYAARWDADTPLPISLIETVAA